MQQTLSNLNGTWSNDVADAASISGYRYIVDTRRWQRPPRILKYDS